MPTGRSERIPPRSPDPSAPHREAPDVSDAAPTPPPSVRWLSLGPASRLVGVDPDTLRRWADDGLVEAYVTPGGHRRFDRRSIETLVASRRSGHRPLASLGASSERLTQAYRRTYTRDAATHPVALDDVA